MGDLPSPSTETDTTAFLTKVFISGILAPKVIALLTTYGYQTDAATVITVIGGVLHKVHVAAKAGTGWNWL